MNLLGKIRGLWNIGSLVVEILMYLYMNSFLCIYVLPGSKKDLRCLKTTWQENETLVRIFRAGKSKIDKIDLRLEQKLLAMWFYVCVVFV